MVQTFQRYVPYSSVVNFLVQSLLCLTAFTFVVQVAWYAQLDPTLPSLAGVRLGRTVTTVATLVGVFYLTGYFERRNHLSTALFVPRLIQAVPLSAATLALLYVFVPSVALGWEVAGAGLGLMALMMVFAQRCPEDRERGHTCREHSLDRRRYAGPPGRRTRRQCCSMGECLAIEVARRLNSEDVLERLAELFVNRGVPDHIRSDNGREFTSRAVREWLERIGVKTLFIEPGLAVGERLRGELQRQATRRAAERRDLLHAQGGAEPGARVATRIQPGAAT